MINLEAFSPSAQLVNALIQARLLVINHDNNNLPVVEAAHEAIFIHWPFLKDWINLTQKDLFLLHQVKQAAKDWERQGKKKDFLWQQERLISVYSMLVCLNNPILDKIVRDFIRPEQERLLEEIGEISTSHTHRIAIGQRLAEIGDLRPGVTLRPDGLPDIVWLPVQGGRILIGNTGTFEVHTFYIAKYMITYAQFQAFIDSGGYESEFWWVNLSRPEKSPPPQQSLFANHPRDSIRWEDAVAFCRWLNARLSDVSQDVHIGADWQIRLPTEWEWQLAATGDNPANVYPWGAEWDTQKANTLEARQSVPNAVGMYPHGIAPCGALDMSGNVCEWCLNEYDNITCVEAASKAQRVRRGGSCNHDKTMARNEYRFDLVSFNARYQLRHDFGFRVVLVGQLPTPMALRGSAVVANGANASRKRISRGCS